MTAAASRVPSHLQPRLKSTATLNTPSQSASAASSSKSPIASPETALSRPSNRQISFHPLSDKATAFLIRRTLCSQSVDKGAPLTDLLPPLTSSNDVDLQLYAFIAIIIKEFVYTWYAKVTPDQSFVDEVVKIIAHCTRALEQRLRNVDLEAMLFDELPELLDAHVKAYRAAHYPLHPPPLEIYPRQIYHSLWPSPALSPVPDANEPTSVSLQKENETAYRQLLATGVLAILLPTEDLENDCLTALVRQILSETILGNGVGGKACEPWLLWESVANIAQAIQARLPNSKAQVRVDKSLENTSVEKTRATGTGKVHRSQLFLQKTFWLVLQYAFVAFTTVRFVIVTIASSSSTPSRLSPSYKGQGTSPVTETLQPPAWTPTTSAGRPRTPSKLKLPIISMKIWSCAANLVELDVRMPWLGATISLLQWIALRGPGAVGSTDGIIDKFLSHTIATHVLDPALLPPLLRTLRAALFPSNAPPPAPRPAPSPQEQRAIRRGAAAALVALIPAHLKDVYFGPEEIKGQLENVRDRGDDDDGRVRQVEELLDVFGDPYCNRHVLYAVVELALVRLLPELEEKGIGELLGERLY